jgi:hypothetical protein
LERERYPKGREASRDREISDKKGGPDFSFLDQLAPYGAHRGFKPEQYLEANKNVRKYSAGKESTPIIQVAQRCQLLMAKQIGVHLMPNFLT